FTSRRRHTSFSRDWSSDVCSSDLPEVSEPLSRRRKPYKQKNGSNTGVERPSACIGSHNPQHVQQNYRKHRIDDPMQLLPAFAQLAHAPTGRCRREGEQPQQSNCANSYIRTLCQLDPEAAEIEPKQKIN